MRGIAIRVAVVLSCLVVWACSVSTRQGDLLDCYFTYQTDSGRPPAECVILTDSEETCLDAARCICAEWNPEGTVEEIEQCAEWETFPRGAITFSDFCAPTTSLSLADAITQWAAAQGALVVAEPECEQMPATLPEW